MQLALLMKASVGAYHLSTKGINWQFTIYTSKSSLWISILFLPLKADRELLQLTVTKMLDIMV